MSDTYEAAEISVKIPAPPIQQELDLGADTVKVESAQPIEKAPEKEPDEGVELLRRQLEEKKREAEEARRLKTEAEKLARLRETEAKTYQVQAQDNQVTAFTNAIASYERDAEMLERDYANKLAEGDYTQAARIQRIMAQIESRLIQLAQGKEALEEKLKYERDALEHQRRQPLPQYEPQPVDPIEAQIAQVQSPTSQAWLRSHRDVLADPVKTKLMTAAHWESQAKNIQPDTPEYFSFIESKVYGGETEDVAPQTRPVRQSMAAAPVSRTASGQVLRQGQTVTMRISAAEREMAAANDMTDEEWMQAKLEMIQRGKLNA
jgi:phage host-nuclease inhibitor protein Gam